MRVNGEEKEWRSPRDGGQIYEPRGADSRRLQAGRCSMAEIQNEVGAVGGRRESPNPNPDTRIISPPRGLTGLIATSLLGTGGHCACTRVHAIPLAFGARTGKLGPGPLMY